MPKYDGLVRPDEQSRPGPRRQLSCAAHGSGEHNVSMRIDGCNDVPRGYALAWDLERASTWLRVWFATPVLDRFAFPR